MDILIMAGQLILGLSLLVLIHEAGHYFAARMFGIRVDKFYLFFDAWGFHLFKFKKGDTEYGIGWLPLGGYCKIAGMVDESMDKEQMALPPQSYEYRSKPAWQRLIVIAAGVILNLITGIIIFSLLLFFKEKEYLSNDAVNQIGIYASPAARDFGFEHGDKIYSVNGTQIERFQDAQSMSTLFGGTVMIHRNQEELIIPIPDSAYKVAGKQSMRLFEALNYPAVIDTILANYPAGKTGLAKGDTLFLLNDTLLHSFGEFKERVAAYKNNEIALSILRGSDTLHFKTGVDSLGYIGLIAQTPFQMSPYSLGNAFFYGTKDGFDLLWANARGLGKIFSGKEKASDAVQGPIGIAGIYGEHWIWSRFWYITAMLSLILAFMNILPIPALDGGHIMFTLYEMITRRKPSEKFMEYAQTVGMVLLLTLMVFAVGNDLFKLFQ